jgi:hypothetical protein
MTMLRTLGLLALPLMLLASPASAITANEKMETCKVGAESQKLDGAKAQAFIKKCMAKGNYEPAARKDAKKKPTAMKKPAATTTAKPASGEPQPKQ